MVRLSGSGNSQEEAVMKNLTVEEFDLFTQQAMTGLSRLLGEHKKMVSIILKCSGQVVRI